MVFRKGNYKRLILSWFDIAKENGHCCVNAGYHRWNETLDELISEGQIAVEEVEHRGINFGSIYIYKGSIFEHHNPGSSGDCIEYVKEI